MDRTVAAAIARRARKHTAQPVSMHHVQLRPLGSEHPGIWLVVIRESDGNTTTITSPADWTTYANRTATTEEPPCSQLSIP